MAPGAASESPVELVEVGPRDGLQNEPTLLSTAQKLELVDRAYRAGARRIEVTSFVHPDRVPQLADAEALVAGLPAYPDAVLSALVLNERGYDRAATAGIREINTVVAATETFSVRNQGMGIDETVAAVTRIRERARDDGIPTTITISTAFGCPFEGEVPLETLVAVLGRVAALAPEEIALADTIGVATPTDVEHRLAALRHAAPAARPRIHLHNTRNTAIANVVAAVRCGVTTVDTALAGVGGCPFAPAATGNVATEDVVYALERMGHPTGIDLAAAIAAARWLAGELGIDPPGMVARAGSFP